MVSSADLTRNSHVHVTMAIPDAAYSAVRFGYFYCNFCTACTVTVVIFEYLNRSLY